MSFIELSNVEKSFGKTKVLRGLNFTIEARELVAIRGASGSGKSTLLYLLGGLDHPTSGKVVIDGKNLTSMNDEDLAHFRNTNVGFVFQFHFLLPSMTCRDNILLPARIGGKETKTVEKDIEELAKILGVTHCLPKFPFEISGGEQQRINIIRALSLRPKILLCDEPTGNLDSKNSEKVTTLLKNLAADFGATLLVVTHDDKVASYLPRKIVIEDGQIIG
ncbi:MAG: ABC transporter ATP-binding protein [Bacteriovoracaceae bacterium]|nr:ABC transporter ATP-binding protein [Bacteriovoracaceae bacterium]